jgi:hypothetical protein
MSTRTDQSLHTYRWHSLPFLISLSLVLVALIPLLITFLFIFTQTTPTLIDQADKSMTNDAQTRTQLIDNYLQERLLDVQTVQQAAIQVPNVQAMLTVDQFGSPAFQRDAAIGGYYIVEIGMIRSKDYRDWAIFNKTGQLLLSYPQSNPVQPHGTALVPTQELKTVNAGKTFISPVYFSPQTGVASVDIYAPIFPGQTAAATQTQSPTTQHPSSSSQQPPSATQQPSSSSQTQSPSTPPSPTSQQPSPTASPSRSQSQTQLPLTPPTRPQAPIGILRATLDLKYIASIVSGDTGNNGNGSYAFITDNNGIRIIDANTPRRFTSVAPLSTSQQQAIANEQRFGTSRPVPTITDPAIAHSLKSNKPSFSFQAQPAHENSQFQVVRQVLNTNIVPWNYFVLSPVSSETAVAQQEQLNILIVAVLTTLTVTVLGLVVGQAISRPILRAVTNLQRNSQKLNALATRQQDAASSQMWVVESSQDGLKSVRYYSQATNISSQTVLQMFNTLVQAWPHLDPDERNRRLTQIIDCVQYIKKASSYLGTSNQQLGNALTLAVEVAEQLKEGSRSAGESAGQLDKIVTDLRTIIGR